MSPETNAPMRVPPRNLQAEAGLLACCLIDGADTIARCIEQKLQPEAFYSPAHRMVFEALLAMNCRNSPVDTILLTAELQTRGDLNAVGGISFVESLAGYIETTAHAGRFVGIVREKHLRRRMARAAAVALERCLADDGSDLSEVAAEVVREFATIEETTAVRTTVSIAADVAHAVRAEIAGEREHGTIELGFPALDRRLGRIAPHELVLLAGRPGTGKTSLALQVAVRAARQGKRVLFFGLEMTADELVRIAAAQLSRVPGRGLREAPADYQQRYLDGIAELGKLKFFSMFDGDCALDTILARCRRERVRGEVGLVVVDYLQQIIAPRDTRGDTRERQVAAMSRALKLAVREMGAPFIVCAQLNRASERDDREPRKSDLRESGALEQDADRVLLLHRPQKNRDGGEQDDDLDQVQQRIIVDKHRNGPTGAAWLLFNRPVQTFAEMIAE